MTRSEIFKKAHKTARETRAAFITYRASFTAALRKIYAELRMKIVTEEKTVKTFFRIVKADMTIKFAGTGEDSSFRTLEAAKKLVDYSKGEMIYETDGVRLLYEKL